MTRRTIFVSLIALLALMSSLAIVLDSEDPSPQSGDEVAAIDSARVAPQQRALAVSTPLDSGQVSLGNESSARVSRQWLSVTQPGMDAWTEPPPVQIGEPLDADNHWGFQGAATFAKSGDIGPALDADDPFADTLSENADTPVEIGEPIDADDPETSNHETDLEISSEIGDPIDADDPWERAAEEVMYFPVEIGQPLDAGG